MGPSGVAIVVDRKYAELEEQYAKWKEPKNIGIEVLSPKI